MSQDPTLALIIEAAAGACGVTLDEVLGKSRHRDVVAARAIAVHLARNLTRESFPAIARALGGRNHSTAVTAYQRAVRHGWTDRQAGQYARARARFNVRMTPAEALQPRISGAMADEFLKQEAAA